MTKFSNNSQEWIEYPSNKISSDIPDFFTFYQSNLAALLSNAGYAGMLPEAVSDWAFEVSIIAFNKMVDMKYDFSKYCESEKSL